MVRGRERRIILSILVILLSIQISIAIGNPVAHWGFDKGTDAKALGSVGVIDGDIYGARKTTGRIGEGLEFDGDDYVQIDSSKIHHITTSSFSWSAWYKPRIAPSCDDPDHSFQAVICRAPTNFILGYSCQKKLRAAIHDGNQWIVVNSLVSQPTKWYHLVQTVDDSTKILKLYVDGKLVDRSTYTGTPINHGTTPLRIGTCELPGKQYDEPANGVIDEVRVYDYALDDDIIKQLYNEGQEPTSSPTTVPTADVIPSPNPPDQPDSLIDFLLHYRDIIELGLLIAGVIGGLFFFLHGETKRGKTDKSKEED